MAYNITLEGKNLEEAENLLKVALDIFHTCEVQYWLEGGTLLGIYREARLLPWDNDLDISILSVETAKLPILIKSLNKKGLRVRTRTFEYDEMPYFKKGSFRMIKIRRKRFFGLLKGKVCLDVFIKYEHNGNTYWKIGNKTKLVPSRYYHKLASIAFKGNNYYIPKFTEDYLTYRYGDWRRPKKDWDTFTNDNALL